MFINIMHSLTTQRIDESSVLTGLNTSLLNAAFMGQHYHRKNDPSLLVRYRNWLFNLISNRERKKALNIPDRQALSELETLYKKIVDEGEVTLICNCYEDNGLCFTEQLRQTLKYLHYSILLKKLSLIIKTEDCWCNVGLYYTGPNKFIDLVYEIGDNEEDHRLIIYSPDLVDRGYDDVTFTIDVFPIELNNAFGNKPTPPFRLPGITYENITKLLRLWKRSGLDFDGFWIDRVYKSFIDPTDLSLYNSVRDLTAGVYFEYITE